MTEQELLRILRYCTGEISEAEATELRHWIDQSDKNRADFDQYLNLYHTSREVAFLENFDQAKSWKEIVGKSSPKFSRKNILLWASVAAALLIVMGGVLYTVSTRSDSAQVTAKADFEPGDAKVRLTLADGQVVTLDKDQELSIREKDGTEITSDGKGLHYQAGDMNKDVVMHVLEIPVGGTYDLVLADGTHVWLNSDSKLSFPTNFTEDLREVFLEGEAFFDVTKDVKRPFIVNASQSKIRVLGTSFNISAYSGESMITTLATGKVDVHYQNLVASLVPGNQAIIDKVSKSIITKSVDVSLYTSWRNGVFEFENMSLYDISKQLARWYGVEFKFIDAGCSDRRFTGGIKKSNSIISSLEIIEKTTNVSFYMNNKTINVKYRKEVI